MDLRFADHASFQRAAAWTVGSALVFGAALHPVTALAPLVGGTLGIALGAAVGGGRLGWRLAPAAAAIAVLLLVGGWAGAIAAASVLALCTLVDGPRGVRGLVALALGAATAAPGMWCATRIVGAQQTSHWPAMVATAVAAGGMAIVGAMALVPRHLQLVVDPVRAALAKLPAELDGEVRELCARAAKIWDTAQAKIEDASSRELVRDGVAKTLAVAARSAEVKAAGASEAELAERSRALEDRIAGASDAEVKAQYEAARAAVEDQRRYHAHIRQGHERLVARMHNHVAALEKFELAATGLSAAAAASAGSTVVKQLEELSHDVAASGEALAELEIGDAAPPGAGAA